VYDGNEGFENCRRSLLKLFDETRAIKVLDLIIDICQDIIYDEPDERIAKGKFIRVLYNLNNSDALQTLLEKDYIKIFRIFLIDILSIHREVNDYCVGNEEFDKLGLYELQDILIEVRQNQLSMHR